MGARLALALAIRHPQRVSSLMLIGVDPGIVTKQTAKREFSGKTAGSGCCLKKDSPSFVSEWEKLPLFASQNRLSQTSQLQQRLSRLQHRPDAILWALRTLGTGRMPNLWPHVPSLQMPISLVTGEVDEKVFDDRAEANVDPSLHRTSCDIGVGTQSDSRSPSTDARCFSSHLTRSFGESQR